MTSGTQGFYTPQSTVPMGAPPSLQQQQQQHLEQQLNNQQGTNFQNPVQLNSSTTASQQFAVNRDQRTAYEIQDLHQTILQLQQQVLHLQDTQQKDRAAFLSAINQITTQTQPHHSNQPPQHGSRSIHQQSLGESHSAGTPAIPTPICFSTAPTPQRGQDTRPHWNISPVTVSSTFPSEQSQSTQMIYPHPTAPSVLAQRALDHSKSEIQILTEAFTDVVDTKQLKLPNFKGKKKSFKTWKQDTFTTIVSHKKYKSMVIKENGIRKMNPDLSEEFNEVLYASLLKTLNDDTKLEINFEDFADDLDGLGAWNAMEKEFGLLAKEDADILDLVDELKQLKREKQESVKQYHARFVQKFEECQVNKAINLPQCEYYFMYLKHMNEDCLHSIMLEIKTKTATGKEWKALSSFKEVRDKAISHIKASRALNGAKRSATSTRSTVSTQSSRTDEKDSLPPHMVEKHKRVKELRHKLQGKTQNEQVEVLLKLSKESTCFIHKDTTTHKFLNCILVEKVCREEGAAEALKAVRNKSVSAKAKRSSSHHHRTQEKDFSRREKEMQRREQHMMKQQQNMTREITSLAAALRVTANNKKAKQGYNPYDYFNNESDSSSNDLSYSVDEEDNDTISDVNSMEDNSNNEGLNFYPDSILRTSTSDKTQLTSSPKHVSFHPNLCRRVLAKARITASDLDTTTHQDDVADSGATHNMRPEADDFEYINKITNKNGQPYVVELGDGSCINIEGEGPVRRCIPGKVIRYWAYWVPGLSSPLYSIKQHMRKQGCYFHCQNNTAILAFPSFTITLDIEPEIIIQSSPVHNLDATIDFDEILAKDCTIEKTATTSMVKECWVTDEIDSSIKHKFTQIAQFQTSHPDASIPTRATEKSIGYDLSSIHNIIIPPNHTVKVRTGIHCTPPPDTYIRIASRSSLAIAGINTQGGVVDPDYTGEIQVILHNSTSQPVTISKKQRIAQLIFEQAQTPMVHIAPQLQSTNRSNKGFGSTGRRSRKRGFFHLDDKTSIFFDTSNPRKPRARKVNRPIVQGIHMPLLHLNQSQSTDLVPYVPPLYKKNEDFVTVPKDSQFALPPTIEDTSQQSTTPITKNQLSNKKSTTTPTTNKSTTVHIPPQHRVNSTETDTVHMSQDMLLQAIGFLKPDKLLRKLDAISLGNVTVSNFKKTKIDPGEVATMPAKSRNSTPSPPSPHYSDVWHMDIGFGPCTAIGGAKYALLFVDKHSRYKRVYPLKNLKGSLIKAVKLFYKDVKVKPKTIRTDFDPKLIQGEVATYIEQEMHTDLQAAPPKRQHQNGLVERAWQTIVAQSRNWLTSQLLPTKYWYFAVKRAVEVLNILPTNHIKNKTTTPFELVHGQKVDYRQLFPMFSCAYIKKVTEQGGHHKSKFKSQSVKCIVVGKDNKSDAYIFYHPPSKQTLTCQDGYRFDTFGPSGPQHSEVFDGNFTFNTKGSMERIHRPASFELDKMIYTKIKGSYEAAVVLNQPVNEDEDLYTIRIEASDNIIQVKCEDILDHNPDAPITNDTNESPIPLLPWIQDGAKATLFLPQQIKKPQQGHLLQDNDDWKFRPGRSKNNPNKTPINLHHFLELAQSMVNNKKLFCGWRNTQTVLTARHVRASSNIIAHRIAARHVSATTLDLLQAPTLTKHNKLSQNDKLLWDAAYKEEYEGLLRLGTWEVISEEQYKLIKKSTGNPLPTMAISTIKKDKEGNPKRCKYRIVALGNLDPHNWSKSDCFAPVISQAEVRLLCSIAANMKRIPKSGDVSQAFCQGILPNDEEYVIRPPPGCPITPKNSYWKLIKTLYGLKRSPRHWYEKAKSILLSMGLKQVTGSPCMFYGEILQGQPPLYIGIYVDDFIFFSKSDTVEQHFQQRFGDAITTTFDEEISHFLGIAFHNIRHTDGHVTIHMSQEAFTDTVLEKLELSGPNVGTTATPYRSGFPVDKIPTESYEPAVQAKINHKFQQITGCFQWLATSTRPDLATITNMLSKYTQCATKAHLDACKHVGRYLKGTKYLGISFTSRRSSRLEAFVKFPLDPTKITPFTDANWGPQDQSNPNQMPPLSTSSKVAQYQGSYCGQMVPSIGSPSAKPSQPAASQKQRFTQQMSA